MYASCDSNTDLFNDIQPIHEKKTTSSYCFLDFQGKFDSRLKGLREIIEETIPKDLETKWHSNNQIQE